MYHSSISFLNCRLSANYVSYTQFFFLSLWLREYIIVNFLPLTPQLALVCVDLQTSSTVVLKNFHTIFSQHILQFKLSQRVCMNTLDSLENLTQRTQRWNLFVGVTLLHHEHFSPSFEWKHSGKCMWRTKTNHKYQQGLSMYSSVFRWVHGCGGERRVVKILILH